MSTEMLPFAALHPNPFQPPTRWPLTPASVQDLADDILVNGLIHLPVARRLDGVVQIGVGHRRVAAFALAFPGQPIPVDIRDLTDRQMYDYVIAEGAQRLDWSPIEKGDRMADYMTRFHVSQTETAKRFGITQGAASNLMRLARDLPAEIKPLVNDRSLPQRFARTINSLARVDRKISIEIAREIAKSPDGEREERAGKLVASFLDDHAHDLDDIPWPADWSPDSKRTVDGAPIPACQGCSFTESALGSDYCTRPACFDVKTKLFVENELARLSKKFCIALLKPGEKLHGIEIGWNNEDATRQLLADKTAERDHLRLTAQNEKNDRLNYHMTKLLGSKQIKLVTLKADFEIKPAGASNKSSSAPKSPPADETPAQKQKREAKEESARQARRDEKSDLRRAKADILWLVFNTAERVAPSMKISGGVLDYCYDRMHAQGYYSHNDWIEFIATLDELVSKTKASTGDTREDRVRQAILIGQIRREIAAYGQEQEFNVSRAIDKITTLMDKVFRLELPTGWSDIPIHKTASNCHVCGKFTSLAHITKVDEAAGWVVDTSLVSTGFVTCSAKCRDDEASQRLAGFSRYGAKAPAKHQIKKGKK